MSDTGHLAPTGRCPVLEAIDTLGTENPLLGRDSTGFLLSTMA